MNYYNFAKLGGTTQAKFTRLTKETAVSVSLRLSLTLYHACSSHRNRVSNSKWHHGCLPQVMGGQHGELCEAILMRVLAGQE
jgi:hypothetical protein